MPLPIPNLDDRTFDQLASEARELIPGHFPAWTDHNLSDPGITLLELFAFLFEATLYQLNRVPDRTRERFAQLVGAPRNSGPGGEPEPIDETLARALEVVTTNSRAITASDVETLVKNGFRTRIARVRALAVGAPSQGQTFFPDEVTVKVTVLPTRPEEATPIESQALRQSVFEFLRGLCPITTRLQVVVPIRTPIRLAVTVARRAGDPLSAEGVAEALRTFLSPLQGGPEGAGWEFGRPVFRSELYQRLEDLPGVDHVRELLLDGDDRRSDLPLASGTDLVELVDLHVAIVDSEVS